MKLSRREWLVGTSAIAIASGLPRRSDAWPVHGFPSPILNPLLSQRNIINLGFASDFTYGFINHVVPADSAIGPTGTNYTVTTNTWMQLIDQNGYPNNASGSGGWGMGVRFPASSNFAGPYVITWDGDGTMQLTVGTWTEASTTTTAVGNANGSTTLSGFSSVVGIAPGFGITGTGVPGSTTVISVNYSTKTVVVSAAVTSGSGVTFTLTNGTYTKVSNGKWSNTSGVKPYILVSNSGLAAQTLMSFNNISSGGAGGFLTNLRIYRQADEVDGAPVSQGGNGLTFRAPFKQPFVNLNPGAIRFLNWVTVLNNTNMRFEGRSLPTKGGAGVSWVAGPAYGATAGTNQITLAAGTGTSGNPQVTTASMVHGEIAQCRMTNALVRSGSKAISAITQANPGVVTATAHGFSNGDLILLRCGTSQTLTGNPPIGMVELNFVTCTITFIDANTFSIGIDTTLFTTFTVGTKGLASACQAITLQVGSGNDRVAYPVVSQDMIPTGVNSAPWAATGYQNFVFDKNQAGTRSAGTNPQSWTQGVWIQTGATHSGMMPLEYATALIYELNTLSRSQGITNPIHMMVGVPAQSLMPVDPDYSTASDWPVNQVKITMEGNLGYPGLLNCPNKPSIVLEHCNETWNFGQTQTSYLASLNFVRNGSATSDASTMASLRSVLMARDIASNSAYASRVKCTLGMQGSQGSGAPNNVRASGTAAYFSDAWNTWQGGLTPMSFHDCCNWGSYFDPSTTYTNTTTGTGTFTDDSAMFNGTDNSGNGGGNYTGAANPTQAITNFVANQTSSTGQTIKSYCDHANPTAGIAGQFDTLMSGYGKRAIGYEGGTDWQCAVGVGIGSHTITTNDSLFLCAVNQSSQWAAAQAGFFNDVATLSVSGLMPIFTYQINTPLNLRWCYISPDTYSGGVEGAAFSASPMLSGLGTRNQALTV